MKGLLRYWGKYKFFLLFIMCPFISSAQCETTEFIFNKELNGYQVTSEETKGDLQVLVFKKGNQISIQASENGHTDIFRYFIDHKEKLDKGYFLYVATDKNDGSRLIIRTNKENSSMIIQINDFMHLVKGPGLIIK